MKRKLSVLFIILSLIAILSVSAVISAEEAQSLPTVTSVTVANTENGVYIKWKSTDNSSYFKVMRKADSEMEYTLIDEVPGRSFTDSSALSGVNYSYKVIPCTADTEGLCQAEGTVMRLAQPLITKAENTADGVKVSWNKVAGATRYTLYFRYDGNSSWTSAGTFGDVSSALHKKAKSGRSCTYTLIARSATSKSSFSKEGRSLYVLSTPKLKSIGNVTNGIAFRWNKIEGAESYMLYRRAAGKKWSYLTTLPGDKTSFTDTTMNPGYTYAYTVRALSGETVSAYTSGMAYRYIPVGDVTTVRAQADGLKVSWKASPYATGYKLYRKAEGDTSWKRIATLNGRRNVSYTDTKVTDGKTYTYTLITVCSKYQSTFNTQGKSYMFLSVPTVTIAHKTVKGYSIDWQKVDGATHYYVYRKSTVGESWEKLARVGNTDTYNDKTADKSKTYYYSVRAGANGKYFSTYGEGLKTTPIDPDGKMVALTYDDGPHNTQTNRILDVLEKYDARATFFVVGSRISSNSQPMIRAAEMGCEIGSHTYSHINLPTSSDSYIRSELDKTDDLVEKYTGERTVIMRPPGGATSSRSLAALGKPAIMWSVDTRDWEHRTASRTVSHIKNNVYDGAIILMHDLYAPTAAATETIVPWLINNGYQLVTVSELMYYRGITMKDGGVYRSARP